MAVHIENEQADQPNIAALNHRLEELDLASRLRLVCKNKAKVIFTTSLGIEDQVITAVIGEQQLPIDIVTLDTGRLFPETLKLIEDTQDKYGIAIQTFRPTIHDINAYINRYGANGFYESVEARHACCQIRKLQPLTHALKGASYWITGLRRSQSGNRNSTAYAQLDEERGLIKINPLADWDDSQIQSYTTANGILTNPLHKLGYPSIGCEPCTRAIKAGEHERAGRWWWENDQSRECGLHQASSVISPLAPTNPA